MARTKIVRCISSGRFLSDAATGPGTRRETAVLSGKPPAPRQATLPLAAPVTIDRVSAKVSQVLLLAGFIDPAKVAGLTDKLTRFFVTKDDTGFALALRAYQAEQRRLGRKCRDRKLMQIAKYAVELAG